MKSITFEVPSEVPYIVLCIVILGIECFFTAYLAVVPKRVKHFTTEFMAQFKEEHQAAFGKDSEPANGGFPDSGNGYYSEKLSYEAWYEFNCAQRVHLNFVETMP